MNSVEHNPSSLASVCTDTLALSEGEGGQQLWGWGQWGARRDLEESRESQPPKEPCSPHLCSFFQIAHPPLQVPISSLLCPTGHVSPTLGLGSHCARTVFSSIPLNISTD